MTPHEPDLSDLIAEIKQAKQQLVIAHDHREQAVQTFKQLSDQYDQADTHYMNLMQVLEYCIAHDCDPTYAKIMLSDPQKPKKSVARGSVLQSLPQMGETSGLRSAPTFKRRLVDWLLRT